MRISVEDWGWGQLLLASPLMHCPVHDWHISWLVVADVQNQPFSMHVSRDAMEPAKIRIHQIRILYVKSIEFGFVTQLWLVVKNAKFCLKFKDVY